MPQNGQFFDLASFARLVSVREADEVEHQRVDNFVRERVLLVEEDANEERICAYRPRSSGLSPHYEGPTTLTGVLHIRQSHEGGRGVAKGNLDLGQDRSNNGGFLKCAARLCSGILWACNDQEALEDY